MKKESLGGYKDFHLGAGWEAAVEQGIGDVVAATPGQPWPFECVGMHTPLLSGERKRVESHTRATVSLAVAFQSLLLHRPLITLLEWKTKYGDRP